MSDSDEVWPNGAPAVGDRAERSRGIEPEFIEYFSEITGDRNPLHYDEAVAAATHGRELVVQGEVTSGILNAVVAEDPPDRGPCS